eukprot:1139813-Pelagomonas_calceolata.AAC.1
MESIVVRSAIADCISTQWIPGWFVQSDIALLRLIEIKYCEDTRPGRQLEAVQRQHSDLCKLISAEVVTLHTILLGIGGTCYTEHTLNQFRQLGLDHQRAFKLAHKLHAHSVMLLNKLVTTKHAIENNIVTAGVGVGCFH